MDFKQNIAEYLTLVGMVSFEDKFNGFSAILDFVHYFFFNAPSISIDYTSS